MNVQAMKAAVIPVAKTAGKIALGTAVAGTVVAGTTAVMTAAAVKTAEKMGALKLDKQA